MAAQAQRIADLERQMAELRAEFEAVAGALDYAFAAGRASVTDAPASHAAARASPFARAAGQRRCPVSGRRREHRGKHEPSGHHDPAARARVALTRTDAELHHARPCRRRELSRVARHPVVRRVRRRA